MRHIKKLAFSFEEIGGKIGVHILLCILCVFFGIGFIHKVGDHSSSFFLE